MYTLLNFAKGCGTVFITTQHLLWWKEEGALGLKLFNFSNSLCFGHVFFKKTPNDACFHICY